MSRCYICDWSPTGDSLYQEGLTISRYPLEANHHGNVNYNPLYGQHNRLISLKNGATICEHCDTATRWTVEDSKQHDQYQELQEENQEELPDLDEFEEAA